MAPELSPGLLEAGLRLAGLKEPPRDGSPALAPASERLGAHPVLSYAVGDGADTYRRMMRILYLEHQAFGLRLRPAQLADRLRERYELSADLDWLEERLATLNRWGAVERDHDASLASTAAEWRRNRYTYDVTPAGRATEELLQRLDALGQEIGRLDTARLPSDPRRSGSARGRTDETLAGRDGAPGAVRARAGRGRSPARWRTGVHAVAGRPDAHRGARRRR